jgi:uncharacterized MAPEG superfamily protein
MITPIVVLLGFAGWTLVTLAVPVGWYRWSRILTGRAGINDFEGDSTRSADANWYQRAQRAHANCLENLPLYTAVVVAQIATGASHPALDPLAITFLVARVGQTSVHVACQLTRRVVSVRFTFFCVQLACMIAMSCLIVAGVGTRA